MTDTNSAPIKHIVCFALKEESQAANVYAELMKLQETCVTPQGERAIVNIEAGTNHSAEGFSKGFNVCRSD